MQALVEDYARCMELTKALLRWGEFATEEVIDVKVVYFRTSKSIIQQHCTITGCRQRFPLPPKLTCCLPLLLFALHTFVIVESWSWSWSWRILLLILLLLMTTTTIITSLLFVMIRLQHLDCCL